MPDQVDGMDMNMVMPATWDAGYAALMFSMWWVMMIAMMLPSATPVILLAATVNRNAATPPFGPTAAFTAGYLLAWGGFSAVAVALQWGLESGGELTMALQTVSTELTAGLLIAAERLAVHAVEASLPQALPLAGRRDYPLPARRVSAARCEWASATAPIAWGAAGSLWGSCLSAG